MTNEEWNDKRAYWTELLLWYPLSWVLMGAWYAFWAPIVGIYVLGSKLR